MADSTQISDPKFSALPAVTNLATENFLNGIILPHPDVHCTVLDGEAVLLNLKNGHYYTLNRVGTVAWELFKGDKPLKDVCQTICSRFDVSEDQASADLVALVTHLGKEGLIQQERR